MSMERKRPDLSAENVARLRGVVRQYRGRSAGISDQSELYEKRRIESGKTPWPAFDTAFESAVFPIIESRFPGFMAKLDHVVADATSSGHTPEFLELGGRTRSESGDVSSITVGLTDDDNAGQNHIPLSGDLTTSETRTDVLNTLDTRSGGALVFVNIRPKAFIGQYLENEYARLKFTTLLRRVYDRLQPGGMISIDIPQLALDEDGMARLIAVPGTLISREPVSKAFLIEKRANPALPSA